MRSLKNNTLRRSTGLVLRPLQVLFMLFLMHIQSNAQWENIDVGARGNLNAVDFIDEHTGWMAGDAGTVLKTTDGGRSWENLNTETNIYFLKIDFASAAQGWALARDWTHSNILILYTENGGHSWQTWLNRESNNYNDFFVINDSTLFAVGSEIATTSNAGDTWSYYRPARQYFDLSSVWFMHPDTGLISGSYYDAHLGRNFALLMRTNNGGGNWDEIPVTAFQNISHLAFSGRRNGYFLARDDEWVHYFCHTADAADSWEIRTSSIISIPDYQLKADGSLYLLLPDSSGKCAVSYSSDNGENWATLSEIAIWNPKRLYFSSGHTANVISGIAGVPLGPTSGTLIMNSLDGGHNWVIREICALPFAVINDTPDEKIWIGGGSFGMHESQGDLFFSDDSGNSWIPSLSDHFLVADVEFTGPDQGFVLTREYSSHIYKTSNGGLNWRRVFNGTWNDTTRYGIQGYDILFTDEMNGWMAGSFDSLGSQPLILATHDGGETWDIDWRHNQDGSLHTLFFLENNAGWAAGSGGVLAQHTVRNGWQTVPSPTGLPVNKVYFSDETNGWLAGGYRDYPDLFFTTLLNTTNGGTSWQEVRGFNFLIQDMVFTDSRHGWAGGSTENGHGVILHTSDGGASWNQQIADLPAEINALSFSGLTGWAAGGSREFAAQNSGGLILRTENGGVSWTEPFPVSPEVPELELLPNYPNPFNPVTQIRFRLSRPGRIKITVYNVLGQTVTLQSIKLFRPGVHNIPFNAKNLPSGTYTYRVQQGSASATGKMLLLK